MPSKANFSSERSWMKRIGGASFPTTPMKSSRRVEKVRAPIAIPSSPWAVRVTSAPSKELMYIPTALQVLLLRGSWNVMHSVLLEIVAA